MTQEEQKAFFFDQGYLAVEGVVSPDELVACEEEIRKLHGLAAKLAARGDARSGHFQREPYAKDKRQDGLPVLRKIEQTRDFSEVFKNLAAHPKLVPVVQNLIGAGFVVVSQHPDAQTRVSRVIAWVSSGFGLLAHGAARARHGEHRADRFQFGKWVHSGHSRKPQVGHAKMGKYCAAPRCRVDRSQKSGYVARS